MIWVRFIQFSTASARWGLAFSSNASDNLYSALDSVSDASQRRNSTNACSSLPAAMNCMPRLKALTAARLPRLASQILKSASAATIQMDVATPILMRQIQSSRTSSIRAQRIAVDAKKAISFLLFPGISNTAAMVSNSGISHSSIRAHIGAVIASSCSSAARSMPVRPPLVTNCPEGSRFADRTEVVS